MDRAIVTFHDPKSDQKIIVNFTHDESKDELNLDIKFDPTPNEDDQMGLIGFLSELLLTNLYNGQDNTAEGDSGEPGLRD